MPMLSTIGGGSSRGFGFGSALLSLAPAPDWTDSITQSQKFTSDAAQDDYLGGQYQEPALAMNKAGDYYVVGANRNDDAGSGSGSAYVFKRTGTTWSEQAKLVASDATVQDGFGTSTDISSDNNYVAIGAPQEQLAVDAGAVYIYARTGDSWSQQAKLEASDEVSVDWEGGQLGSDVGLDATGTYCIAGAYLDGYPNDQKGAAYIFKRSGTSWSEEAKLIPSDAEANDRIGLRVDISADGLYAAVGAVYEDTSATNAGSIYIFVRSGSSWSEQAKLNDSNALAGRAGWNLGQAVSLSDDGQYLVAGAPGTGVYQGSAYVYKRTGTSWALQQKIDPPNAEGYDNIGKNVDINSDGSVIVIGSNGDDDVASLAGAAFVYQRDGTSWSYKTKITASDGASQDRFGGTVAISGDGFDIAAAAPYQDHATLGFNCGSVYAFSLGYTPPVRGDEIFYSSGTFTVPTGVTSISAVAIGGGGGGMYYANSSENFTYAMGGGSGGALAWINGLSVTAGQTINVVVGAAGQYGIYSSGNTHGGDSRIETGSSTIFTAGGGKRGNYNSNVAGGTKSFNTTDFSFSSTGGGDGGSAIRYISVGYGPAGGGGAGGYSADGGDGRDNNALSGDNGSGGSASGGGAANDATYVNHISGGGGGVSVYGEGTSGLGQTDGSAQGGSGGQNTNVPTNADGSQAGGGFGGGGGGKSSSYWGSHAGNGAPGVVRIVWGAGRSFPSTDVGA
jgi:hypothetical protein